MIKKNSKSIMRINRVAGSRSYASTILDRINPYNMVFIAIIIIFFIVLSVIEPIFISIPNLLNILVQATIIGLLAIGITPVLISGGIDLSMVAIMALAGIIGTSLMGITNSTIIGILVILMIGILGGAFNGFCIVKLKMVPFVVTLSTMIVATGFATFYTKGESIFGGTDVFLKLGIGNIGFLPVPILFLIVFGIVYHLILSRSFLGRFLYATGINSKAAKICAISTDKIAFLAYVNSGLFAGLAAIIMVARLGSASPAMAKEGMILDYISSAVIGGVSIYGGKGTIVGAIMGALLITVLGNSMNLLEIHYFTILMVKGLVIIVVVGLDTLRLRGQTIK